MVPLPMTLSDLWPRFQGHDIFRHWISQETTRDRAVVTVERQQEVVCALSNGDRPISNDLDGPQTRFSMSRHFCSRISEKRCVLGTKLLKNTNRKPYTIYHFQWPWVIFGTDFKIMAFLKSNIIKDKVTNVQEESYTYHNEWYYVWWPWLTSKCVARVCQHQLSFLFKYVYPAFSRNKVEKLRIFVADDA